MTFSLNKKMIIFFNNYLANFHGGSVVANYPWDNIKTRSSSQYSQTSDDDVFRSLALTYSSNNPLMSTGVTSCGYFKQGITNGGFYLAFLLSYFTFYPI